MDRGDQLHNQCRTVLADDLALPVLGQGAWCIGDDPAKEKYEIAALRRGIELGNNPMVGATVACAVAVEEAMK